MSASLIAKKSSGVSDRSAPARRPGNATILRCHRGPEQAAVAPPAHNLEETTHAEDHHVPDVQRPRRGGAALLHIDLQEFQDPLEEPVRRRWPRREGRAD